jgi:hypothetical protein
MDNAALGTAGPGQMDSSASTHVHPGRLHGLAGLLPFVAALLLALLARNDDQRALGLQAFVAYAAVILSFLGGIRWGAALTAPSFRLLGLAVLPSLLAFGLLLLPPREALPLFALGFAVVGGFDVLRPADAHWPGWFRTLRLQLTVAVVALHLLLIVALPG